MACQRNTSRQPAARGGSQPEEAWRGGIQRLRPVKLATWRSRGGGSAWLNRRRSAAAATEARRTSKSGVAETEA